MRRVKSTPDKLKENRKRDDFLKQESLEKFQRTVNHLFSGNDGKEFLKSFKKVCGVDSMPKDTSPNSLYIEHGKRSVWFELIEPYIDRSILKDLI